jgi:putative colanic acid biosynthesis glycosyltransferase
LEEVVVKVLQINSVCGVGSTGRIATDLYKILEEQGHECVIAYGRGNAPKEIKTIKIGTDIDNYIHVAKTRFTDKHGFGSIKATKEFISKVKQYDPDIIHLHNIHGYYINIEILFEYLKDANKPVVWTLHDCWTFTGHCAHFDYVGCDNWKEGCSSCPQKKEYPASVLINSSKWNYQKKKELFTTVKNMTIVTPSEWLKRFVEKSFLGDYDIKVINNGIDVERFKPTESDFRKKYNLQDKFIILGVSNVWIQRKGYEYFIKLSKNIQSEEVIVLVGVTEKQKRSLPNNIIGITKTNSIEELAEIYSAADVFVNLTLEEVMGLVNVEALACGTPVITFKTGGSVECVDQKCGIIVKKGDIQELITAIKILKVVNFSLEDCIKRSKLYNKNDRYNGYIKLYKGRLG